MENAFNIRLLRKKAKMTQSELVRKMGYQSSSLITMWESGIRRPPSTVLPKLAKALNCSLVELFSANDISGE